MLLVLNSGIPGFLLRRRAFADEGLEISFSEDCSPCRALLEARGSRNISRVFTVERDGRDVLGVRENTDGDLEEPTIDGLRRKACRYPIDCVPSTLLYA
jgi:hypothetical protein